MAPWAAAIGGIASLGGGIIGAISSEADRNQAIELGQQAYQQILDAGYPPDLSEQLALEQLKQAGILTPELEHDIQLTKSKVSEIQEDPQLKQAQMQALQTLQSRGQGGLSSTDRGAYEKIRSDTARDTEAKRQQILQSMQARGIAGSGAELASQLQASQEGANRQSEQGMAIAGQASQNALNSILAAGNLGGQIRGQDFDVANTKAGAEDAISRFNTQNQISAQQRNVASKNQAQQYNLGEQQRISDYNTQLKNAEMARQQQAKRQFYLDQQARAQALAGAKLGQAGQARARGDENAAAWQGAGSGIAGTIGGIGQAQREDDFLSLLRKKYGGGDAN